MSCITHLSIIFLSISSLFQSINANRLLNTSSGIYEGRTVKHDGILVQQYLGIEYARIHRRFDRATPITRQNDEIISANYSGTSCKPTAGSCIGQSRNQKTNSHCLLNYGIFSIESMPVEQCLFLNVFIPNQNKTSRKKAVFMWIHGGSGQVGSGNLFDGTVFAALGDIIVVTFNFRLNLFGFLSTGDERLEGNLGLYDQALVLDWIYINADALGADQKRITVGGHSAGAPHAYFLAISPFNRGRIRRLILQSGSPFNVWSHLKAHDAMEKFVIVAKDNACGHFRTFNETLACLRERDFNAIEEQEHQSYTSANHTNVVITGDFMGRFQETFEQNDSLADVDFLIGATDDEGIYVAVVPIMIEQNSQDVVTLHNVNFTAVALKFLAAMKPDQSCLYHQALKLYHIDDIPATCSQSPNCFCAAFYNYSRLISDILFNYDYYRFIKQRAPVSKRTYIYQYSHRTAQEHPTPCNDYLHEHDLVGHFAELEYTWGSPLISDTLYDSQTLVKLVKYMRQEQSMPHFSNIKLPYTEEQKSFSRQLIEQWSSFINDGEPKSSRLTEQWPPITDIETASVMILQLNGSHVKKLTIPSTVELWSNKCSERRYSWITSNSHLNFNRFSTIFIITTVLGLFN